ncbi:MAG: sugar phosphate isomerase/epimerase family protein [Verrucomicrobiota bacterium]
MNRRSFLRSSAILAAFAPAGVRAADKKSAPASAKTEAAPASWSTTGGKPRRPNKKGFMLQTLGGPSKTLTLHQKFQLLKAAGFDGVEVPSALNQSEVLAARDAFGLEIPSVVITTHWAKPLTHPSENERKVGLEGLLQGLRDAKVYGAKSVLLVPGIVNKDVSYADAYTRSIAEIKKAIPLAEELGVVIAIENVWNAFLMSPLEAAAYVDGFKSPMIKWHFDVGNVVNTGWPQHWIPVLGDRIAAIHVKEFSRKLRDEKGPREGFKVELLTGDSDWPAVMAALDATKYSGWLIAEHTYRAPNIPDAEWLSGIVTNLDRILAL